MYVEITNVTDAAGKSPRQIDIYNKTLDPGDSVKVPSELVDEKIRSLEKDGYIAIGQVPSWYAAAKSRKGRGRSLTVEELARRISKPPPKNGKNGHHHQEEKPPKVEVAPEISPQVLDAAQEEPADRKRKQRG